MVIRINDKNQNYNNVTKLLVKPNGNETGKIDLLNDEKRSEISNYAKKYHTTITQGPFELKQGGSGIAIRNPVYLEDESGQEYFWGLYDCDCSCAKSV